jgi:hypothetical protein
MYIHTYINVYKSLPIDSTIMSLTIGRETNIEMYIYYMPNTL